MPRLIAVHNKMCFIISVLWFCLFCFPSMQWATPKWLWLVKWNVKISVKYIIYWTNNLLSAIFKPVLHYIWQQRVQECISGVRSKVVCECVQGEYSGLCLSARNFIQTFCCKARLLHNTFFATFRFVVTLLRGCLRRKLMANIRLI